MTPIITIKSYDKEKHSKQIEDYLFNNIQDAKQTSLTSFIDTKNASYYKPGFVALNGQDVVGFIFGSFDYSSTTIKQFCVFEKFRKKGLGKKLLQEFERYVRFNNQKLITLIVFSDNLDAIKFYGLQGYKKCGHNDYCSLQNNTRKQGLVLHKFL